MKKILQEFKQFAMRGNVIDMAVGIIIGGAFGKIVSSVVGDIIMPAIGLLIGGVNFTDLKIVLKQAVMDGDKVFAGDFRFHHYRIFYFYVSKRDQCLEQEKRRSTGSSGSSSSRYTVAYRDT